MMIMTLGSEWFSCWTRVTPVKSSVGIITHQSRISKVDKLRLSHSETRITSGVSCENHKYSDILQPWGRWQEKDDADDDGINCLGCVFSSTTMQQKFQSPELSQGKTNDHHHYHHASIKSSSIYWCLASSFLLFCTYDDFIWYIHMLYYICIYIQMRFFFCWRYLNL